MSRFTLGAIFVVLSSCASSPYVTNLKGSKRIAGDPQNLTAGRLMTPQDRHRDKKYQKRRKENPKTEKVIVANSDGDIMLERLLDGVITAREIVTLKITRASPLGPQELEQYKITRFYLGGPKGCTTFSAIYARGSSLGTMLLSPGDTVSIERGVSADWD